MSAGSGRSKSLGVGTKRSYTIMPKQITLKYPTVSMLAMVFLGCQRKLRGMDRFEFKAREESPEHAECLHLLVRIVILAMT